MRHAANGFPIFTAREGVCLSDTLRLFKKTTGAYCRSEPRSCLLLGDPRSLPCREVVRAGLGITDKGHTLGSSLSTLFSRQPHERLSQPVHVLSILNILPLCTHATLPLRFRGPDHTLESTNADNGPTNQPRGVFRAIFSNRWPSLRVWGSTRTTAPRGRDLSWPNPAAAGAPNGRLPRSGAAATTSYGGISWPDAATTAAPYGWLPRTISAATAAAAAAVPDGWNARATRAATATAAAATAPVAAATAAGGQIVQSDRRILLPAKQSLLLKPPIIPLTLVQS